MPPPRPCDILGGTCRTGARALASGSLVVAAAEEPRALLLEHLPRGAEVTLLMPSEALGWPSEAL